VGSNPPGALLPVSYDCCCQEEVYALGRSLVQRSPTDCGAPVCVREDSIMRRPWPTRKCCAKRAAGGGRLYDR